MNIFVPDPSIEKCVLALDDKRIVKMILETAQLLCGALFVEPKIGAPFEGCYRITHQNHPCAIWTRIHPNNWLWLHRYFREICTEYQYRFDKIHLSDKKLGFDFIEIRKRLVDEGYNDTFHTPFANCSRGVGYDFSDLPVHEAYKRALEYKWQHDIRRPTWTKRQKPDWRISLVQ